MSVEKNRTIVSFDVAKMKINRSLFDDFECFLNEHNRSNRTDFDGFDQIALSSKFRSIQNSNNNRCRSVRRVKIQLKISF